MKTKITNIGPEVQELLDGGVLIMFNPNAPEELKEVAVLHEKMGKDTAVLHQNGKIIFGDQAFNIDFVGSEANNNFDELGHLSIYFNNTDEDMGKLPGSIFVSSDEISVPNIELNQIVEIY